MSIPWTHGRQAIHRRKVWVTSARERSNGSWRNGLVRWSPFVAFCLLGAVRWLADDRWPDSASTLATRSAGCGLAACLAWLALWSWSRLRRGDSVGAARESVRRNALGGLLMIGGPAIPLVLLPRGLDSGTLMIALSLTPVAAGVTCVAIGEECDSIAGLVWPGLAAMAGMLLMLPQPSLADPTADLTMLLAPIMTGVGAALLAHEAAAAEDPDTRPRTQGMSQGIVVILSAAALFFGVIAVLRFGVSGLRENFDPLAALLDGATAWLAVVSVRRLGAMRFAAQSALVPLAVLLEGLILMRPPLTARLEFGMLLLAVAGISLLVRSEDDSPDAATLDLG